MEELQARVTAEQGEKAELINRSKMLVQTLKVCSWHGSHQAHWWLVSPAHAPHYSRHVLSQLRKEELRQLRVRQAAPADAEEDALSREFAGSVTLTFREDRTVTLTPAQAGPQAQLVVNARRGCRVQRCGTLHSAGGTCPCSVLPECRCMFTQRLLQPSSAHAAGRGARGG